MHHLLRLFVLCIISMAGLAGPVWAQSGASVAGRVLDGKSGEGLPGASVYSKLRPQNGTSTDADGGFTLRLSGLPADTLLVISSIGFQSQTLRWRAGGGALRVRLQASETELGEVVVRSGENPAYAIVRRAVARKSQNSIASLPAYELEAYNRLELLLTNTDLLQKSRALRQVRELMERQGARYRDRQGRLRLPLSRTETVSTTYYRHRPQTQKEVIQRTRTVGIGLEAGDGVTQLLSGSGFRDYNLYQNSIRVLNQSLPSPLADTWRLHYEFWLEDSVRIGDDFCYRLAVVPRRPTDLVFTGTIWVSKPDYALRRVDLQLSPKSHLNFVDDLRLRQEGARQPGGTWLARSVDYALTLDLKGVSEALPGVRMRLHTDNRRLAVTEPQPAAFYAEAGPEPDDDAAADTAFWRSYRTLPPVAPALPVGRADSLASAGAVSAPDSLAEPATSYGLLDSLRTLPSVRRLTYIGRTLSTGYADLGKVELGYLPGVFAYNNVEGARFGLGLRTTPAFSRGLNLDGSLAYGFEDRGLKYNLAVTQVLSRIRYTQLGFRTRSDLQPLAQLGAGYVATPVLLALNRWGNLRRRNPFAFEETTLWLEHLLQPGLMGSFSLRRLEMAPLYPRVDLLEEDQKPLPFGTPRTIRVNEATLGFRFTQNERAVMGRTNQRRTLRLQPAPTFTLTGVLGQQAGGEGYQKLTVGVEQRQFAVGGLGVGDVNFQAGCVFGTVPYALLKVHQGGGPGPFLFRDATQTLAPFELVSDQWAELHYTHYFNDLILGQLPGLRALNARLGWRLLATTSVLWGSLRSGQAAANEQVLPAGRVVLPFSTLRPAVPFIEVGYGVENIFKVLRVDFVHRLTYRAVENEIGGGARFVVKLSGAIKL